MLIELKVSREDTKSCSSVYGLRAYFRQGFYYWDKTP